MNLSSEIFGIKGSIARVNLETFCEYPNIVGDKICPGAECTKIKSSTTNTEDVQTDENNIVASTTAGTTQT